MNAVQPATFVQPLAPTSAPLHIALLGYRSHPHVGGQGIYLRHLAGALLKLGHQVDVISGPPYPELPDGARLIKIPSLNLYECKGHHMLALRPKHLRSWADVSEWWAMANGYFGEPYSFGRRVYHYLRTHGRHYHVIHDNQSLSYGLLRLQREGFPVVATIHHPITRDRDFAIEHAKNALHRAGARRWYKFVDMQVKVARELKHLVSVSEFAKADICSQFGCAPARIQVIKNGVDVSVFKPLPEIAKIPGRIITTTSSDQPLKGFAVLLRALASLLAQAPHAHLRVIGKLAPKGANQKLLRSLGLEHAVSFVSGISDAELNREYAQAQLAVCPSLYEGFGLPAAEAMAAGVPVVSSDGGALAEVVGDCGLLVPAGDHEQLSQAMQQILGNATLANAFTEKGLQRILSGFCWQHAAQHLTGYYHHSVIKARDANR